MAIVWLSEPAENELKGFNSENQQEVANALALLEDDSYRKQNGIDLNLIEKGFNIYNLVIGVAWLAFHEEQNGDIYVDWISIRSRVRPF